MKNEDKNEVVSETENHSVEKNKSVKLEKVEPSVELKEVELETKQLYIPSGIIGIRGGTRK